MPLERELQTYRERLPELLKQQGRFVVIHGDRVIGVFGDYEDALKAGYDACGTTPFLVKRIAATETVNHLTRGASARCRT